MNEELPGGWTMTTLARIAKTIQYGFTASADHEGKGPRFLRITDIQGGRVNWDTVPSCEVGANDLVKYRLGAGDVVFARSGATTGKSYLIRDCPADAVFASYLIRVRASEIVDAQFLSQYFQTRSYWEYISDNVAGNAQPNCNGSKLAALPVPLPPLAEQRRIVAKVEQLLAKVEASRGHLAHVPAILRRFRQAVLAAACSGKLTEEWRSVHGTCNGADVDDLPAGWRVSDLGSLIDGFEAGRNLRAEGRPAGKGEYGVLKISAVTWGAFRPDENKALFEDDKPRAHEVVRAGDLLITRANTSDLVGAVVLVDEDYPRLMLPDKILRLKVRDGLVDRRYLLHALRTQVVRDHFAENATGTSDSMRNLAQPKLAAAPITLPPMHEQREIVRRIEQTFALLEPIEGHVAAATQSAEKLVQAILSRAFRGEIVPTEAELAVNEGREYESAAQLLARVEAHKTAGSPLRRSERDNQRSTSRRGRRSEAAPARTRRK